MARVLNSSLLQALRNTGGTYEIYWAVIFQKSSVDTWTYDRLIFSNIRTLSWTGSYLFLNTLKNIGSIDAKIDGNDPMAKISDVSVEYQNIDSSIAPRSLIGHHVEIRMGYGSTISSASSTVFFTGEVYDFDVGVETCTIKIRGKGQLRNKLVGVLQSDQVFQKNRGKIMPISHGDWSGEDDYLPIVLDRDFKLMPQVKIGTYEMKSVDEIRLWDKDSRISYRALAENYTVEAEKNIISFWLDTSATLTTALNDSDTLVNFSPFLNLVYDTGSGSTKPASPTIIRIDNEFMLVWYAERNPPIKVERGWGQTTPTAHSAGAKIFKVTTDWAKFLIRLRHTFFPSGFSGMHRALQGRSLSSFEKTAGLIENMAVLEGKVQFKAEHTDSWDNVFEFRTIDLVFPKIGITGEVIEQYFLLACRIKANCTSTMMPAQPGTKANIDTVSAKIILGKNLTDVGSFFEQYAMSDSFSRTKYTWCHFISIGTDNVNRELLEVYSDEPTGGSQPGERTVSYNNIADVDDLAVTNTETAISMKTDFYTHTPLPASNDVYSLINLTSGKSEASKGAIYGSTGGPYSTFIVIENSDHFRSNIIYIRRLTGSNYPSGAGNLARVSGVGDSILEYANSYSNPAYVEPAIASADLDNVEDLNDTRYSLVLASFMGRDMTDRAYQGKGQLEFNIWQVGFRIEFLADVIKNEFFIRGQGRVNPGTYNTPGSAGDLMVNPVQIIEDILCRDVALDDDADLDGTYFLQAFNDRADWVFASTVFGNQVKMRELIKDFCEQTGLIYFERFDGKIALQNIDMPATVSRQITSDEIINEGGRNSFSYEYEPSTNMITEINIKYRPLIPERGDFLGLIYCKRTIAGAVDTNFTSDGALWGEKFNDVYNFINIERPLTIEAPFIRDAETAERLAKSLAYWKTKNLIHFELDCTYSVADVEIGDKIKVPGSELGILRSKTWLVVGTRIVPAVKGNKPKIILTLKEFPFSDTEIPEVPPIDPPVADYDYQEVFTGGFEDDYQELFAGGTGDDIQEVFTR